MSKIQKITLSNLKAISEISADFKGCTAIVTGGNNKGKTTFLRSIPDRVRFIRPDVMVKTGEKEGRGEMELTSGERFVWEFDVAGKDKLTFITTEGVRQSVTVELGSKFFPKVFDIDKFLQSSPKSQAKQLQAIIGLDFEDIDARYQKAYDLRTERNREAELYRVKLEKLIKCDRVDFVDLTDLKAMKEVERDRLNEMYKQNQEHNKKLREQWEASKDDIDKEVYEFNLTQTKKRQKYNACYDAASILIGHGFPSEGSDVIDFLNSLKADIKEDQKAADLHPKEPTYINEMPDRTTLDEIDKQIEDAVEINASAQKYKEYRDHVKATADAREAAGDADIAVKKIEAERLKMIESANMPKGIEITPEGILVDGLPLDRNQISTSKLYTSALRIAAMNLGEVKTLHFDASFLDKNSLSEIEQWANENDLQLLIERPSWDSGEIAYELLQDL